jgi:hypothetical protein
MKTKKTDGKKEKNDIRTTCTGTGSASVVYGQIDLNLEVCISNIVPEGKFQKTAIEENNKKKIGKQFSCNKLLERKTAICIIWEQRLAPGTTCTRT